MKIVYIVTNAGSCPIRAAVFIMYERRAAPIPEGIGRIEGERLVSCIFAMGTRVSG